MDTTLPIPQTLGEQYRRALWGMMDRLGVDESLWWKIMVAVGIQFGAGVALAGTMVFLEGPVATAVGIAVLLVAAIAFFNTALIVREDFLKPLRALETSAEKISAGSLTTEPARIEQDDEIGALADSFGRMHEPLQTTAKQADSLANENFEAPVLDETVPGAFGNYLDRMAENLSTAISDLEARSARLTRLIDENAAQNSEATDQQAQVATEVSITVDDDMAPDSPVPTPAD